MTLFCANCDHRVEPDVHGRCSECGSDAVAEFQHAVSIAEYEPDRQAEKPSHARP